MRHGIPEAAQSTIAITEPLPFTALCNDHQSRSSTMPPYIQNLRFDAYAQSRSPYYVDEDEVVGLEVRKKSLAGNIWEALTGKKKKGDVILFSDDRAMPYSSPNPRPDLACYEQPYFSGGCSMPPPLCRYHSYSPWRYRYIEEEIECHDCVCCRYDWTLGPRHHRFGGRGGGRRRYDYYEHGEEWDATPFWDADWVPPRYRRSGRSSWLHRRRRNETADQTMRWEMIKLMRERLNEARHERIYGEWPTGYSLDNWRRRNDRIHDLEGRIDRLRRWQEQQWGDEGGMRRGVGKYFLGRLGSVGRS